MERVTSVVLAILAPFVASACAGRSSPTSAPVQTRPPAVATEVLQAAVSVTPFPEPQRKPLSGALVQKLDEFFEQRMPASGATGMGVGLLIDGAVAYERTFGVRDVETKTPLDGSSVFRIGSLTKGFTALSVMKLRDEGKLSLDAPASTYVPELGRLALPVRDAPPISARLLMTHASGLAYDDLWGAVSFGKNDAELMKLLEGGALFTSAPGMRSAYSNLGYALLGTIVERVSGTEYRDYVTANVLRPLGMSSTVWESRDVTPGRLAVGYHRDGERLVRDELPSDGVFEAAGGLYTSLHDAVRYTAYHLGAYPPRDDAEVGPVRRNTLREMHLGQRPSRGWGDKDWSIVRRTDEGILLTARAVGFGWQVITDCDVERVTHGGFEPGYFAYLLLIPKSRFAFVALAASGPAGGFAWPGLSRLLHDANVLRAPDPSPAHPALVAAKDSVTTLVGRWDQTLADRTFDPQSLRYSWNLTLRADFAKLARDHGVCRPEGELATFGPLNGRFRLSCERGAIEMDVLMSPENPPRVQHVEWKQELEPDERTKKAATRIAALISAWNAAAAADVFGPPIDLPKLKKTFAHRALDHGACTVERGAFEIKHAPMTNDPGKAVFRLKCASAPLELAFGLDDKTGKVAHLSADPLHGPDAACWQ